MLVFMNAKCWDGSWLLESLAASPPDSDVTDNPASLSCNSVPKTGQRTLVVRENLQCPTSTNRGGGPLTCIRRRFPEVSSCLPRPRLIPSQRLRQCLTPVEEQAKLPFLLEVRRPVHPSYPH